MWGLCLFGDPWGNDAQQVVCDASPASEPLGAPSDPLYCVQVQRSKEATSSALQYPHCNAVDMEAGEAVDRALAKGR